MLHRPLLAAAFAAAPAFAQLDFTQLDFTPLVDINTSPVQLSAFLTPEFTLEGQPTTPFPENFYWDHERVGVLFGGKTLFFARTKQHGDELWMTDGTAAGTQLVADVRAGTGDSTPFALTSTSLGLMFGADDGSTGFEPYLSDGTAAGTQLIDDVFGGSTDGFWGGFTDLGGLVLFTGQSGPSGSDVFRTDGTAAGTFSLKPAALGSGSDPDLSNAAVLGGYAYFQADGPGVGFELFRSDGTLAGTTLVADLQAGSFSSYPDEFTPVPSGLVFRTNTSSGAGLRHVDAAGTITNLSGFTKTSRLQASGGLAFATLYNGASGDLVVRTDGTPAGTTYAQVPVGATTQGWIAPLPGGAVMFAAHTDALGLEPYAVDALAPSAQLLTEVNTGTTTAGSTPQNLAVVGPRTLYFTADSASGRGVHRWDPVAGHQELVGAGALPTASSTKTSVGQYTPLWTGSELLVVFTTFNAQVKATEVWATDGTPSGTQMLIDETSVPGFIWAKDLVASGNQLFFTVGEVNSFTRHLYVTDGTPSGTSSITKFIEAGTHITFDSPTELTPYQDGVVFATSDGDVLWTDGTIAGTKRLYTRTGAFDKPQGFKVAREQIAFFVEGYGGFPNRWQLWTADLAGATKLYDFQWNPVEFVVPHFGHIGPDLYFYTGRNLTNSFYRTDLTSTGTVVVQVKQGIQAPVRVESRHIGTVPHVIFDSGGSSIGSFNGAVYTPLPATGLTTPVASNPIEKTVFAGGGYLQIVSKSVTQAVIEIGDFVVPSVVVWESTNLAKLDTSSTSSPSSTGDLRLVGGELVAVLDDEAQVGEELYRSPFNGAFVRDLNITGNSYSLELSDPILGGTARLSGLGAPAGAPQLVFAGALLDAPLAVGGIKPTTPLWLAPVGLLPITNQVGSAWTMLTTVPGDPALIGATLGLQGGYIDPATFQIHASNALMIGLWPGF